MSNTLELSARLGAMSGRVHGFIYFAPEATEEYDACGLPAAAHYFASRGAALGEVTAEVVTATFYNFNPELITPVIPMAWSLAEPSSIQAARMRAAGRVLRRVDPLLSEAERDEATQIAAAMVDGVGDAGRPLAAANRAVVAPSDSWEHLWQLVTVIREWRGDGHVAALIAAPADPVEALVLHAATGQVPKKALVATRRWPVADWEAAAERLRNRGLLDLDDEFTEAGRAFRDDIEHRTNVAAAPLVDAVGPGQTQRLIDLLRPISQALLDHNAFRAIRP